QAEDRIRVWSVTGVQTCALPISDRRPRRALPEVQTTSSGFGGQAMASFLRQGSTGAAVRGLQESLNFVTRGGLIPGMMDPPLQRSEERRVGEEGRVRGRRGRRGR